jgi:threonine dehydratase
MYVLIKLEELLKKILVIVSNKEKKVLFVLVQAIMIKGVAFACNHLNIKGTIYMPSVTPQQKIEQTQLFGDEWVSIVLIGDTFDDSYKASIKFCSENDSVFVPPFDDPETIEGQATVCLEIIN